jgi:hypothetical protein
MRSQAPRLRQVPSDLVARHVRAVLFDQCGYGDSSCPGSATRGGTAWA